MHAWSFVLPLDSSSSMSLVQQISQSIIREIRRGRLLPGATLPGTRALATTLGVHRNTVIQAYEDLVSQGWLTTRKGASTQVAETIPDHHTRVSIHREQSLATRPGFAVGPQRPLPERIESKHRRPIMMYGGVPDLREVPVQTIARAWRHALAHESNSLLDYTQSPSGHPRLRRAIASFVREARGIPAQDENVMIVRGSQMSLYLLARVLLQPEDLVCVESLGYRPAWNAFRVAGATVHPIPVDADGLDVEALQRVCSQRAVRAVYLTPQHHYPTTVTLSAARRVALMQLAQQHRFAILEDDYDHEFHYEGRPVAPMAATDSTGHVVYIGTLSKIVAPGLRVGWIVAPASLIRALESERTLIDRQGDAVTERAIAELLEVGELQRHVRRMRREYLVRRDTLLEALHKHLRHEVQTRVPAGGMALWVQVDPSLEVNEWSIRCRDAGVVFQPGRVFSLRNEPVQAIRLGYTACTPREIETGVLRMKSALRPT